MSAYERRFFFRRKKKTERRIHGLPEDGLVSDATVQEDGMSDDETSLREHYLESVTRELERMKDLAERALAQVGEGKSLHLTLDKESNNIAVLIRHLSGNMISRWTDFLTTDGEKPDRHRDGEFEPRPDLTRQELMAIWSRGWNCLLEAIRALTPGDLNRRVTIRGQEHSVVEAIHRQLTHYASHVGQIVFLAKHIQSDRWKPLTIPRGKSEEYFRRK
ncbi:MAG: DUF1572 family protein [Acidobacteriota bacterium]